ncbi:MAG: sensor domain-containing diguanylate cyclase [Actinomycetota bacterium]|nr:sensor domain-containing diguanylate cyclase [Actinomycetota bacterium]
MSTGAELGDTGAQLGDEVRKLSQAAARFRQALNRLGDALGSTHDRTVMVNALLVTTAAFVDARTAVFYGVVTGAQRLRAMDSVGVDAEIADLQPGEGVAGTAGRTGRATLWPGPERPSERGAASVPAPSPAEPVGGASTAVAVPVRSGGHPFGVLALYGRAGDRPYDESDVEELAVLVRQAETSIENSFLYDEAVRLSITDGMTGLWNRRHFDLRLESELSRAIRFSEPFAVVFAELDQMKAVNDTHGHQAGDTVLIELARRLTEATREVDLVARWGGDEFTLLLPNTGVAGALRLADKIRHAVASEPFRVEGAELNITISVGVAAYPEHGSSGKDLVAAADAAMYRAKAGGRNRVEHAKVAETGGAR